MIVKHDGNGNDKQWIDIRGKLMISTTIFPGRYIQGYDAIGRLPKLIPRYGTKGLLIFTPHAFKNIMPGFRNDLEESASVVIEKFGRECSDEEISRLAGVAQQEQCDVIVGIGGGKTLDTAKAVAYQMNAPVIVVPTLASTDAPCTSLSVIYRSDTGRMKRVLFLPRNPDVVLVDTKVIAHSPVRLFVAGMGDALATWFEAESCRMKYARNLTRDRGSMSAYALAHLCYQTLLDYGVFGKMACEVNAVTPAFEHVVEANTLLSGVGCESGGLATAHAIQDGFNALEASHSYYHGEKVAFGTLVSLFLTDKPKDTIDEVYSFCEAVGLPTTLGAIGLEDVSDTDLMKVSMIACSEKETIHNEPVPVTAESVFAAIKLADHAGRKRRNP